MSTSLATRGALPLSSILTLVASMFCFAVVDALAKLVALQYPPNEVTFFRMLFGLLPAFALCVHGPAPLRERVARLDLKGQTLRAITLLGATGLFFAGLPYIPLGEAVAIAYSETLLVVLLAPLVLHEKLTTRAAVAASVGFAGVLLVVRPGGGESSWLGPLFLLSSALCGAFSIMQIKRIRATDDSRTTVLFFTLVGALVTGVSLAFSWRTPDARALGVMALLGAFGTVGQLLMTVAYRRAAAGALAPFNYTSVAWATLFGYVVWHETIHPLSMCGIALIVGSAIAVASRRQPHGV